MYINLNYKLTRETTAHIADDVILYLENPKDPLPNYYKCKSPQ